MSRNPQQRRINVAVPYKLNEDDELRPCEVEIELDDVWVAVLTFGAQGGAPVVEGVEVRLRPANRERDFDMEGSVIRLPQVPQGGLSLRTVRLLTFGEAVEFARQSLQEVTGETLEWHGFNRDALDVSRRPGRRGRTDSYYAAIAAAYVDAIRQGSTRPVAEVAKSMSRASRAPYSAGYVRESLRTARKRGLLTQARHGAAEGELTAHGRTALEPPS